MPREEAGEVARITAFPTRLLKSARNYALNCGNASGVLDSLLE